MRSPHLVLARLFVLLPALLAAGHVRASFHTLVIEQLYSNADGSVQYIALHESVGQNGENLLAGHAVTVTGHGFTHTFTFPADLPGTGTAGRRVLLATRAFPVATAAKLVYGYPGYPPPGDPPPPPSPPPPPAAASGAPDYVLPDRFLPTDGATVDYAGVDHVTYAALPVDGDTALSRDGTPQPAVATNFAGVATALHAAPVAAIEFYQPALDHYFISTSAPDIDALDSGRFAGWLRTGKSFRVYPSQAAAAGGANPVCRFYIPPEHGDSHFFSASPAECADVLARSGNDPNYSGFVEETDHAFFVALPDTTSGACPAGTIPVYRLFDNRVDANHRYTTDPAVRAEMVARGYVAEGYGPDAVIMCALP
jgi:hypothetical protein